MDNGKHHDSSVLVDVKVNWKTKKVWHKNKIPQEPEGLIPVVVGGSPPHMEEAYTYMRLVLENAGIDAEQIAGWEDCLRMVRIAEEIPGTRTIQGYMIPAGTLYLRINLNHRDDRKLSQMKLRSVADVVAALKADEEACACAKRLFSEYKVYRVWLDIRDRQFDASKPFEYDTPMARLQSKRKREVSRGYRIKLAGMDIIF